MSEEREKVTDDEALTWLRNKRDSTTGGERSRRILSHIIARLRAPASEGEAVDEDDLCEVCLERRATVHLEGAAANQLCAECHMTNLERIVNGPVGETRRLLASFIERVGGPCGLDHHGYCQSHFLELRDQCTVKRARDLLATHPAPATVTREWRIEHFGVSGRDANGCDVDAEWWDAYGPDGERGTGDSPEKALTAALGGAP